MSDEWSNWVEEVNRERASGWQAAADRRRAEDARDLAMSQANRRAGFLRSADQADELRNLRAAELRRRRVTMIQPAMKPLPDSRFHDFQITDFEAIPLERLRPWLTIQMIEQAIRMGVRLGLRELPGVRIYLRGDGWDGKWRAKRADRNQDRAIQRRGDHVAGGQPDKGRDRPSHRHR